MNPLAQTILVSVLTGGGIAAILTFVQFLIKRHDDKKDKKSGTQAELVKHGRQLDALTELVEAGNDEQKKTQEKLTNQGEAIAGLEHDRIIHVGAGYMKEGRITLQEYDDIRKYLFEPYQKLGGNGTAEDVMDRLKTMIQNPEDSK